MRYLYILCTALSTLVSNASALGQVPSPEPPPGYESASDLDPASAPTRTRVDTPQITPADLHDISITWSPIHLIFPVVELTAEFRAADSIGIAGIFGAGQITALSAFRCHIHGHRSPSAISLLRRR